MGRAPNDACLHSPAVQCLRTTKITRRNATTCGQESQDPLTPRPGLQPLSVGATTRNTMLGAMNSYLSSLIVPNKALG